jgi:hypothetical protein
MQYPTEKQTITVKIKRDMRSKPKYILDDLLNGTHEMVYENVVSQRSAVTVYMAVKCSSDIFDRETKTNMAA